MNKISLFIGILIMNLCVIGKTQIINLNPDPNGNPWIAGDVPDVTPEIQAIIDQIPKMTLTSEAAATDFAEVVDNSQEIYMRPVFGQFGGSCGQASGVGYTFTYEINYLRDLPANDVLYEENWYTPMYTYNFLNNGNPYNGTWYFDGWDIIMDNGCPNVPNWGGMTGDPTRWVTGYNNYYSAMNNRIDSYYTIGIGTPEGLDIFKHWLNDHNEGDTIGGLSCFSTYMEGYSYDTLSSESAEAGKAIMKDWNYSTSGHHAMTFVGYNDNIKYDLNEDGLFTNDLDINHDGDTNMLDWEIGALKIVNSWGYSWPNPYNGYNSDGYCYFPYRLLAKTIDSISVLSSKLVYVLKADSTYFPEITFKFKISYPSRDNINIELGYANSACQDSIMGESNLHLFSFQGGNYPMQGDENYEHLEGGLDYNYWFYDENWGEVFLIIYENDIYNQYDGEISEFSIIDYRWNEVFELPYSGTLPVDIDIDSIALSIEYDLLPFNMGLQGQEFLCNKICRKRCTISGNIEIEFGQGINVDFYNGTLVVEEGGYPHHWRQCYHTC